MDTKKEIEGLLKSLKTRGIDRDKIENDLNYSKNYIDQTLSKGGNRRFLNALKSYADSMLQKATRSGPDVAYIKDESLVLIELKTASGKTIQVKPEGESEITLLNAFLEERDRVIETLKEEKQARIDELVKEKEALYKLLNSGLLDIAKVQQAIFAMVRTLQEHEAVITSSGNKKREVEMLNTLSKLNGDNLKIDAKQDNALVLHISGK